MNLGEVPVRANILSAADQLLVDGVLAGQRRALAKAITLIEYQTAAGQTKKRVVIDETACKGCGTCQATCPKGAIFVWHFKPDMLRAMTMAALGK